ncbi:MAG: hypothetical protein JRJ42_00765 [Deltaproteobacteria bacterium]|nr:hypothetical protein [Deltaproteobacteria bacterium]
MKSRPNPIHKSGTRNVFCPYYEKCLDHAVERRWRYWKCSECPHKLRQQPLSHNVTIHAPNPCYELPWKTYREIMYRFG